MKIETALRGRARLQFTVEIVFISAPKNVALIMSNHHVQPEKGSDVSYGDSKSCIWLMCKLKEFQMCLFDLAHGPWCLDIISATFFRGYPEHLKSEISIRKTVN